MAIEYTHPDAKVGPDYINAVPEDRPDTLFFRLEARLAQSISVMMVLSSMALGLLMAVQVLMRYGLESPFLGIEELAPMLALWAYFLGMIYATRDQDHISGGIVALLIKNPYAIKLIRFTGSFLCLFATAVFGYYAWKFAQFNIDLGRKSIYMRWPKYMWDISMVCGFVLMGFYYCLQIVAEFKDLRRDYKNKKAAS
ncbi:TRAP transporter small permease [Aliamphritea hakodatensis]|uniref:TRAP transporter small permease n=1 Tax=Aliamphritea hakodatensis TaxID=2895352 RepID=UPI0022FD956B|nr:TRAP transporter small permease [Aliamphritea hakodatensis]